MSALTLAQSVSVVLALVLSAVALYLMVLRPWFGGWGATREERLRRMPFDDLIPNATAETTRAITIHARADEIWPWLVQMGEEPRGGFYSFDWVERLMGTHVHSVQRILPDFQVLRPGDTLDVHGQLAVHAVLPERFLVVASPLRDRDISASWTIALYPVDANITRLVARTRLRVNLRPRTFVLGLPLDVGHFLMEWRWLRGVARRAEERFRRRAEQAAAETGAMLVA